MLLLASKIAPSSQNYRLGSMVCGFDVTNDQLFARCISWNIPFIVLVDFLRPYVFHQCFLIALLIPMGKRSHITIKMYVIVW